MVSRLLLSVVLLLVGQTLTPAAQTGERGGPIAASQTDLEPAQLTKKDCPSRVLLAATDDIEKAPAAQVSAVAANHPSPFRPDVGGPDLRPAARHALCPVRGPPVV